MAETRRNGLVRLARLLAIIAVLAVVPAYAQQGLVGSDRLLGRDTASPNPGQVEQLTVSGALSFTGSGGITATGANILAQLTAGTGLDFNTTTLDLDFTELTGTTTFGAGAAVVVAADLQSTDDILVGDDVTLSTTGIVTWGDEQITDGTDLITASGGAFRATGGDLTESAATADRVEIGNDSGGRPGIVLEDSGVGVAEFAFDVAANGGANADRFDIVYPAAGALRFFGSSSFSDGAAFQGFGGTDSQFAGQMYFDYGSTARDLSSRWATWRSMASTGGTVAVMLLDATGNLIMVSDRDIGWNNDNTLTTSTSIDTAFCRDAAGVVEVGTAADCGTHGNFIAADLQTDDDVIVGDDVTFASGGVISWDAGDVTITHSANDLAFAGVTGDYSFDDSVFVTGVVDASTDVDAGGDLIAGDDVLITDDIDFGAGDVQIAYSANDLAFTGVTGDYSFDDTVGVTGSVTASVDVTATAGDVTSGDDVIAGDDLQATDDLLLPATGAVINFDDGDCLITHSANTLSLTGCTGEGFAEAGGGIAAVVEDETPQLGGDLDLNGFEVLDATMTAQAHLLAVENGFRFTMTDDDASGVVLDAHHNSASPADGDLALDINVYAGADDEEVGRIALEVDDGSTTSEDTRWRFFVDTAGSTVEAMTIVSNDVFTAGTFDAADDVDAADDLIAGDDALLTDDIDFGGGDVQIAYSANDLAFTGVTGDYSFDDTVGVTGSVTASVDVTATAGDVTAGDDVIAGDDVLISASGVINFESGDCTLTDGTNMLTMDGCDLTTEVIIPDGDNTRNFGSTSATWAAGFFTSIELGHDSDTTITRSSAGVIAVEGVVVGADNLGADADRTDFTVSGGAGAVANIDPDLSIDSTADAVDGIVWTFEHSDPSPDAGDDPFDIVVNAGDDQEKVGGIQLELVDDATTTEDTSWLISIDVAGANVDVLTLDSTGAVVVGTVDASVNVDAAGDLIAGDDALLTDDIQFGGGDVIIGYSANALAFSGVTGDYTFDDDLLVTGKLDASTDVDAADDLIAGDDIQLSAGALIDMGGGDVVITFAANDLDFTGVTGDYSFDDSVFVTGVVDASTDVDAGGDLIAGDDALLTDDIQFGGGDVIIGYSANALAFSGVTGNYSFDDQVDVTGAVVASTDLTATAGDVTSGDDVISGDDVLLSDSGVVNFGAGDCTMTDGTNTLTITGCATIMDDLSSIGGSTFNMADNNLDQFLVWDDSAGQVIPMPLASYTTEAAPASGDKFLLIGAEGDARVVDFDDMPGGSGDDSTGKQTMWIPAWAMVPATTNGCAVALNETGTNDIMYPTCDFDTTTQEAAHFSIAMPKQWNEGTVTIQVFWSHPATVTNFGVEWDGACGSIANDGALDTALGTAVEVGADTGGTTDDLYVTSETGAITCANAAADTQTFFRVRRVPADGSDNLAVDARLHGIKLFWTNDAATSD